ncbi:RNA polymerase sigma factor [Pedobacter hiemivivus]|nr:sigma-70 family RNA polymerase sigma factor [Pedobacter hiemivivus]
MEKQDKKLHELPDSILWNKFLMGDDEAYAQVYKQHFQKLFIYGLFYSSDRDVVKDCIQDVFVKIYNKRRGVSSTDNIFLYLAVAVKNSIINAVKKHNRKVQYLEAVDEQSWEDEKTPESLYIDRETQTQNHLTLDLLLSQLTDRQRGIISSRFLKGMSISEISEEQGVNYQSVSNIIQRSLIKIKALIKK